MTQLKWLLFKLAFFYPRVYAFFCYYRKKGRRKEIEGKFTYFLQERLGPKKRKKVVRHIFELRGSRKVMNYLIPLMDEQFIERYVTTEGLHYLDRALEKGRGVVLMTGHFGNGHLAFSALRAMNYDLTFIKGGMPRTPGRYRFRYVNTPDNTIFIHDPSLAGDYKERILQTLRSGKIIHYYGDTREGRVKENLSFLGRTMGFSTGIIHLAHQANAVIIPMIHLYQRGRIALIFKEPIDHDWIKGRDEYGRIVSEFAKLIETYLLALPEQYLGVYGPTVLAYSYRFRGIEAQPAAKSEKSHASPF